MIMLVSKDVYVLINYKTFSECTFWALSVIGLLVLRYTRPDMDRPFKVSHPRNCSKSAIPENNLALQAVLFQKSAHLQRLYLVPFLKHSASNIGMTLKYG